MPNSKPEPYYQLNNNHKSTDHYRIPHTRTSIWREPHLWPRASCGRSSDAHRSPTGELSPQPGTGETAHPNKKINPIRSGLNPHLPPFVMTEK